MSGASNFKLDEETPKNDFLCSFGTLAFDEMGQSLAQIIATFDVILHKIRNIHIYVGGVMIILSMDSTQIQTIWGHPFPTSCHNIYCFKTVTLINS